jgi:hypothetical protein
MWVWSPRSPPEEDGVVSDTTATDGLFDVAINIGPSADAIDGRFDGRTEGDVESDTTATDGLSDVVINIGFSSDTFDGRFDRSPEGVFDDLSLGATEGRSDVSVVALFVARNVGGMDGVALDTTATDGLFVVGREDVGVVVLFVAKNDRAMDGAIDDMSDGSEDGVWSEGSPVPVSLA